MQYKIELIGIGCIAIFFVYNLVLYSQIKRLQYLYLALLSFFILVRATLVDDGSMIFFDFFPSTSLETGRKIEFFSGYMGAPLSVLFAYQLYPLSSLRKFTNLFLVLCTVLLLFVLITPYKIFYYSLGANLLLIIISYVLMFTIFIKAVKQQETGAMYVLTGTILCSLFVLAELLKIFDIVYINIGPNLINSGFIIFIFFQSIALSKIFAQSMHENVGINKYLEKRVSEKTAEILRASMLRDTLIRVVSHDIRGPLSNLKSTIQLVQEGYLDKDSVKALFSKIDIGVTQTVQMLDELMEWGKAVSENKKMTPTHVSIEHVLNPTLEELKPQIEAKKQILQLTGNPKIVCYFLPNALRVIVRNLVSNAIKFTEIGGRITLIIKKENRHVLFEVWDTGIGIPKNMKLGLFEMDKNIKRSGTANEASSGVGLFICHDLMVQNGGTLTMRDNPKGKGSVFACRLPAPVNS